MKKAVATDELRQASLRQQAYMDKALEQIGVIENLNLKALGEEEVLEALIEEKDDQIVDLLDELMAAEMDLNDLQAEYAEYAVNHPCDKLIH